MDCFKAITDTLGTVKVAKRFACANELRKGHFEKFAYGYALGLVYEPPLPPPHVSKRSAASAPQTVLLRTQDYTHPDDHTSPPYDMTPSFKPFTMRPIFI